VLKGLFIGVLILSSLIPKSAAIQTIQQYRNIASEKYADNFAAKSSVNGTQRIQRDNICKTVEICLKDRTEPMGGTVSRIRTGRPVFHVYKSEVFFHFTDSSPPDIA